MTLIEIDVSGGEFTVNAELWLEIVIQCDRDALREIQQIIGSKSEAATRQLQVYGGNVCVCSV